MQNCAQTLLRSVLQLSTPEPAPGNRASWYTPGLTDGLGDRLLMFDNSAASSLELLRFRRAFGDQPTFEAELRRRVDELKHFMHPAIARVRAVDSLGDGAGLALISNYIDGKRLIDVLHDARGASFATSLIQQIVPALVELHGQGDDIAHGAITPERVVVTPEGGLILSEHVIGSALASLHWPSQRLRAEIGLPVTATSNTVLDGRNDVMQLGFVALSLLLGRRVDPTAYPDSVSHLLDVAGAGPRGSSPSTQLRRWIERALQLNDEAFATAQEALDALDDVSRARLLVAPTAPRSIPIPEEHVRALQARLRTDQAPARRPTLVEFPAAAVEPPRATDPAAPFVMPPPRQFRLAIYASAAIVLALASFVIGRKFGQPRQPDASLPVSAPVSAPSAVAPPAVAPPPSSAPSAGPTTTSSPSPVAPALSAPAPTATPSRLDVTSDPAGATVTVNGTRRGVTPLSLPLPPGIYDVAVTNDSSSTRRKIEVKTGVASSMAASFSTAQASAGYLAIATPIELQILEDGNLIGTTNAARVMLPAGKHSLQLVNRSLGFEANLPVNIPAGKSISASVSLPNGTAFLNALPWANVSIDGRSLGTTPLANIELPIGTHEVVWTHPQFGERKQSITVHVKTPVRLVLDWSK